MVAVMPAKQSYSRMQGEDALRQALYLEAFSSSNAAAGPAQVLFELITQPFNDLNLAAYRAAAPLCCRDWFAADVCLHAELMKLLLDPAAGPAALCRWRYGVVLCLAHVAEEAHARQQGGQQDSGCDATLSNWYTELDKAVRAGPFGEGRASVQHDAAVPAVADTTG